MSEVEAGMLCAVRGRGGAGPMEGLGKVWRHVGGGRRPRDGDNMSHPRAAAASVCVTATLRVIADGHGAEVEGTVSNIRFMLVVIRR